MLKPVLALAALIVLVGMAFAAWPVFSARNIYNAAESEGAMLTACNQAGLVAERWKALGFGSKYLEWKEVERSDCAEAEIARQTYSSRYR